MPVSYEKGMTDNERVTALVILMARRDLNRFVFSEDELQQYVLPAVRLMKSENVIIMPYLEQMLTSKCSLRCRHCANLMQYYRKDQHVGWTLEECIHNLDRLLECVDYVEWFRLLGGEPLLLPWLPKLVAHALAQKQIGRVEVVTNGTIMPSEELLAVMRDPRAAFDFSNYGPVSARLPDIVRLTSRLGIKGSLNPAYQWENMGDMQPRGYGPARLRDVYARCDNICKNLAGGELHVCPRSFNGMHLGLIPRQETDFVNIWEGEPEAVRGRIHTLFDVESISACQYCNTPEERSPLPAGEQMPTAKDVVWIASN